MPTPSCLHALAVGGPNLVSGEGWDVAPLVLAIAMLALMRWSRIPLRAPAVLSAVATGLILDPVTDASGVSLLTTLSILTLVFGVVALRRTAAN
jgi:hypothetical protein